MWLPGLVMNTRSATLSFFSSHTLFASETKVKDTRGNCSGTKKSKSQDTSIKETKEQESERITNQEIFCQKRTYNKYEYHKGIMKISKSYKITPHVTNIEP